MKRIFVILLCLFSIIVVRAQTLSGGKSVSFALTHQTVFQQEGSGESGTARISGFYVGAFASVNNSYARGNLDEFWQFINQDPDIIPNSGSAAFFAFDIGTRVPIKEDRIFSDVGWSFIKPATHAIWGTNLYYGGRNEVVFEPFFWSITLSYNQAIDKKNHLFVMIEPGLDLAFMKGHINTSTNYLEFKNNFGLGWHLEGGINYMLSKNFGFAIRAGARFIKVDAMYINESSSTGYSQPYIDASNSELLKVDWSGAYVSFGLTAFIRTRK